jgi:hypothetical protein
VRSPLSAKLYSYEVLCDEELDLGPYEEHDGQNEVCWFSGNCLQDNTCLSVSTSNHATQGRYYCLQIEVTSDYRAGGTRNWWLLLRKLPNTDVYKRVGLGYYQVLWRKFHLFEKGQTGIVIIV